MNHKRILITAGSTHEHIDPVRYITNASSGRQGKLLAFEAKYQGYEVFLIAGHGSEMPDKTQDLPGMFHVIKVNSADEMYAEAIRLFPRCDAAICAAAVGDYKVANRSDQKIKRSGDLTLTLIPNPDIAKALGEMKRADQKLIGFALETNNGLEHAKAKIIKKNLDYVVLNETNKDNVAFGVETNKVTIIKNTGEIFEFPTDTKEAIAANIFKTCGLENLYR